MVEAHEGMNCAFPYNKTISLIKYIESSKRYKKDPLKEVPKRCFQFTLREIKTIAIEISRNSFELGSIHLSPGLHFILLISSQIFYKTNAYVIFSSKIKEIYTTKSNNVRFCDLDLPLRYIQTKIAHQ